MPRREARVQVTIWTNPDFVALSQEDQRTYVLLFSQPVISLCGVVPITFGRWAGMAGDTSVESLRSSIDRLELAGLVVADYEQDELLVRSFLRHDGVWRNSKTRAGAVEQLKHVTSQKIRKVLEAEIARLEDGSSDNASDSPSDRASDGLNRSGIPSQESPSPSPSPSPSGDSSVVDIPAGREHAAHVQELRGRIARPAVDRPVALGAR